MKHFRIALLDIDPRIEAFAAAADDLQVQWLPFNDANALASGIADDPSDGVFMRWSENGGAQVCKHVRTSPRLQDLTVLAVVDDPWSDDLDEAFTCGIDDYLVTSGLSQLPSKISALSNDGVISSDLRAGKVILADSSRERRIRYARHLRKMGFDVQFAIEGKDIKIDTDVRLVVANAGLDRSSWGTVMTEHPVPWVITGTAEELSAASGLIEAQTIVKTLDSTSDPAQLVFVANELLLGPTKKMRRSARLQYGATVCMRIGGRLPMYGYSYNISQGGLYVRTLTSPPLGTDMEIEFRPPLGRGRVVVGGKVVWRPETRQGEEGTPRGFGLQFGQSAAVDAAAIETGYQLLLEQSQSATSPSV